ncbi:MAG: 30S ribosomal protein S20 [Rhabdochlamydiaceae bacterium]
MAEQKKQSKVKRATALKRDIQNEKSRLRNKSFKSKVTTAIRSLNEASEKDQTKVDEALNAVYSLMDKGVKTGVFKANKADRTKSRLTKALKK